MTENEKNSSVNHTSTSCTSSTDSGVIIIDNTTTFNQNNAIPTATQTKSTNDNNHPAYRTNINDNVNDDDDEEIIKNNNICNKKNNATKININNFINIAKTIPIATTTTTGNETLYNGQQTFTNITNDTQKTSNSSKNPSPTISIRSTSISIVSIDENAVDSSVVDSDSDFEDDTEGVHSKYIVKKLGQQTTYPPNSPDIPNINKGLTVLSQQILPNGNGSPKEVTPFANNIIQNNLGTPLRSNAPQIGSIALTNSTDVTFGDKHYYPGPVTIQQFLIDSRNGQDNPTFDGDTKQSASNGLNGSQKINIPPEQPQQPYKFITKRKKIILTSVFIALSILIGILIIAFNTFLKPTDSPSKILGDGDDSRKNIPINSTIGEDNIGSGKILRIVPRDAWLAQPPSSKPLPLKLPVKRVVIISTQTEDCTNQAVCTFRVRYIQTFNIESTQYDDIIYNFLIGGDGNVYEGRGWDHEGAHLRGYNDFSISLAFIGTFKRSDPNDKQMNVTKLLLEEGVRLGKLDPDYQIIGANVVDPTSPFTSADALYASFKDWPHWSENV